MRTKIKNLRRDSQKLDISDAIARMRELDNQLLQLNANLLSRAS